MLRLDGKALSTKLKQETAERVKAFSDKNGSVPGLAVILVGSDPASQVYVRSKAKACEAIGMKSWVHYLEASTNFEELSSLISKLNDSEEVNGILVQLPLPNHLDERKVLECIDPKKDPDGLTLKNIGALWADQAVAKPCTPAGVVEILRRNQISIESKDCVVVGRSEIVGKPMAALLMQENATVTICHSKTKDLQAVTRQADIVVVAAGRPEFLGKDAFKKGAVVIDVGIHRKDVGKDKPKLVGDVRYAELEGWASAATPVPGGVGPMTIAMLLHNTLELALASKN